MEISVSKLYRAAKPKNPKKPTEDSGFFDALNIFKLQYGSR